MIVPDVLPAFQPAFWLWQEPVAQHSSLVDLIFRASPIAKFVLLVLLVFSVASWAIIFTKARVTKQALQQSAQFLQLFNSSNRWADLHAGSGNLRENPLAAIFLAADVELKKQGRLNLEIVQRAMQSAAVDETTRLEKSMGWLASTASAAPFIGLFGTVVGIIIAFQGLTTATTASIQAVAPGIAEALVATAAGIAAAVPAVLAYNHYVNQIKVIAAEMDSFTLRLLNFIEREAMER
ncbi:MAG: MotA/TolQ/ExbB proton channel family protein [Blastocatellia bacterium]